MFLYCTAALNYLQLIVIIILIVMLIRWDSMEKVTFKIHLIFYNLMQLVVTILKVTLNKKVKLSALNANVM